MTQTKQDLINENKLLKLKIQQLEVHLENFESIQRCKCCDCCEDAVEKYKDVHFKMYDLTEKIKELINKSME